MLGVEARAEYSSEYAERKNDMRDNAQLEFVSEPPIRE
jgi:hypothetical protein